jgi:hypothetical protein
MRRPFLASLVALAFLVLMADRSSAADFNVLATNPSYTINGQQNPTLSLTRGQTYTFSVSSVGHPLYIKTVQSTGTGNAYNNGVTNNGLETGTLTFAVPSNAPNTLFYNCSFHSSMTGTINVAAATVPVTSPIAVGTILVLIMSAGAIVLRRRVRA